MAKIFKALKNIYKVLVKVLQIKAHEIVKVYTCESLWGSFCEVCLAK